MAKKSITIKRINNKDYYYLQHREGDKVISKSISHIDAISYAFNNAHPDIDEHVFYTSVRMGVDLYETIKKVSGYKRRFIYESLDDFINNDVFGKVFILYGLRRTGKTTMMYQSLLDLPIDSFVKSAYIHIQNKDTFEQLDKDINYLISHGFKYIYIDEITLLNDFISSSSVLSDIYGFQAKIILSGTDSLGFLFASNNELYDRTIFLHTTYIPYKEFDYIMGDADIDRYIEFGGTLSKDGVDYNNKANEGKYIYNEYTNTAIARNIEHSLAIYKDGSHFSSLRNLYEKGELTNVINRLIEDTNHQFTISTIERDFKSHDYGSLKELLRKEKNSDSIRYALDKTNEEEIISLLMKALDIINKKDRLVDIDKNVIIEIEEYLRLLDVLKDISYINMVNNYEEKRNVFIEPGLRYAQGKELLSILMNDKNVSGLPKEIKNIIEEKLTHDVKGRLLEEIVQYHTSNKYPSFKAIFPKGEYDLVVIDEENKCIDIYEIKYTKTIDDRQYKQLLDEESNKRIKYLYYPIRCRGVIYRGESKIVNGIKYINVEEYLKNL